MIYTYEKGDTGLPVPESISSIGSVLDWLKYGHGPLVSIGGVEAIGYINTNTSDEFSNIPDMEILNLNGRFTNETLEIVT